MKRAKKIVFLIGSSLILIALTFKTRGSVVPLSLSVGLLNFVAYRLVLNFCRENPRLFYYLFQIFIFLIAICVARILKLSFEDTFLTFLFTSTLVEAIRLL